MDHKIEIKEYKGNVLSKPIYVKAFICQRSIDNIIVLSDGLDFKNNCQVFETELEQIKADAKIENPDIIIFPELSIPHEMVDELKKLSEEVGCIVIAGSQYYDECGSLSNRSPVIFSEREIIYNSKRFPSVPENKWLKKKFLEKGIYHKFLFTKAGNFAVLICMDFLSRELKDNILKLNEEKTKDLDFLIVIALQDNSIRYYEDFQHIINEKADRPGDGLYILYSNCIDNYTKYSDGLSSFWGYMPDKGDRQHFLNEGIMKDHKTNNNCLAQFSSDDLYLQVSFNIRDKLGIRGRRTPVRYEQFPYEELKLVKRKPKSNVSTERISNKKTAIKEPDKHEEIVHSPEIRRFLKSNFIRFNVIPLLERSADNIGISSTKLKFEDFYFPISVSKEFESRNRIRRIDETSIENPTNNTQTFTKIEEYLLSGQKRIIIKGNPGQGKTTFTNWLTTALSCNLLHSSNCTIPESKNISALNLIPLTLNCKFVSKFKDNHNNNPQFLIEKIVEQNGFDIKKENKLINQLVSFFELQKLIIIIDGIEEIQDDVLRNNFCSYIDNLAHNHPQNSFLLTSRVFGYTGIKHIIGGDFLHLRIQDLNNKAKEDFLNRLSVCLNFTKKDITEILKKIKDPLLEPLTRTPLNLTNVCLLYKEEKKFPSGLSEIYLGSLEILFTRKNNAESLKYPLDNELKLLLGKFSYDLSISNRNEFTEDDFLASFKEFLNSNNIKNEYIKSVKKLFSYIRTKVGLFDDVRGKQIKGQIQEVYKFFHDSYREFLAGYFIAFDTSNNEGVSKRVRNVIKYQSYVKTIKEKEVKLLKISEERFSVINFTVACCDLKTKIEIIQSLISKGINPDQISKFKANAVMALHCVSNNTEIELKPIAIEVFKVFCNYIDKNDYCVELNELISNEQKMANATETDLALKRIADSSWSRLFQKTIYEQYTLSYDPENINSEKLELINLSLFEKESLSQKSNKAYLEGDFKGKNFNETLKYCFAIINIAYTEAGVYSTEEFKSCINKIVFNLFNILKHENSVLNRAAAFALYWLNNAKNKSDGIWSPNKIECEILTQTLLDRKDKQTFKSVVPIFRKQLVEKVFYKGNFSLDLASNLQYSRYKIPEIELKMINSELCSLLIKVFNTTEFNSVKGLAALNLASCGYYDERLLHYLISEIENFSQLHILKFLVPYVIAIRDETVVTKILPLLLNDDIDKSFYATMILSGYLVQSNYDMIKGISNVKMKKHVQQNIFVLSQILEKWKTKK